MEKMCNTCRFEEFDGDNLPCSECGWLNNDGWRAKKKKLGECGACAFQSTEDDQYPCECCVEYDEYRPEDEVLKDRCCDDCFFEEQLGNGMLPCRLCENNDCFEKKKEEEKDMKDKNCFSCKYEEFGGSEEPCYDCVCRSEWVKKEEEEKELKEKLFNVSKSKNGWIMLDIDDFTIFMNGDSIRVYEDDEELDEYEYEELIRTLIEVLLNEEDR